MTLSGGSSIAPTATYLSRKYLILLLYSNLNRGFLGFYSGSEVKSYLTNSRCLLAYCLQILVASARKVCVTLVFGLTVLRWHHGTKKKAFMALYR